MCAQRRSACDSQGSKSYTCGQRRLWSACAADPILRWAHMQPCRKCYGGLAQIISTQEELKCKAILHSSCAEQLLICVPFWSSRIPCVAAPHLKITEWVHLGPAKRKCAFGQIRKAKAQISLRIRAVCSGPSLSADRIIGYYRTDEWRFYAQLILCACAGWFEAAHFAHARRCFTLDAAQFEMSERALMNVSLKMKAPEVLKHEFLKAHCDITCNDCQFVLDIQINIPEKP